MGFPFKLKQMDMLLDGLGHLAETEEVTIPKLVIKTEDWRGAACSVRCRSTWASTSSSSSFPWAA
jgi:phage tail tube protein FII